MNPKRLASTQDHLEIEDIRDSIVILKSGNAVSVLQTTAVNFDLLSEGEQDAMIFTYAALLNSLTFPIQVIVRSKITDISFYLARLEAQKNKQKNPNLVATISRYQNFVRDLVAKNQVLDKRFYVIIPYLETRFTKTGIKAASKGKVNKWDILEQAKVQLAPKKETITKLLARIGVKVKELNTQELVELFYDIYNSEVAREQKIALTASDYTKPLVEPHLLGLKGAVVTEKEGTGV